MIAANMIDVGVASGIELMSKYPIASDVGGTLPDGRPQGDPYGSFFFERVKGKLYNQAQAAQAIAETYGITKEMCDEFAVSSHAKAHQATLNGHFKNEIMPTKGVDSEGREIVRDTDETIRPDTSKEKLAALKPVLGTNWITAGISSPVTDGASAVVLMSEEKVKELKLKPLARVVANAVIGSDPVLMLTGPLVATPKVLKKAGMKMDDIDIFEVNEAFAPVPLAWAKHLGAPMEKLNVNGGAIAMGHPLGATGAIRTATVVHGLRRTGGKYGMVTMCIGTGMGAAGIFERV